MSRPKLFSIIDKAVFDYKLIEDGDKILVGASGGKDSTALIEYFAYRKRQRRENFEFTALHVDSGLDAIGTAVGSPVTDALNDTLTKWGVSVITVFADVIGRLKDGRKMNCWWCSTQRRTELNNYAIAHGYNKIALGHHLDDILETLLMNMIGKGELSTMPPRLKYDKYPITVIRPLALADEKTIIEHATVSGYKSATCTCTYQDNSKRKEMRNRLQLLTDGNYEAKRRLYDSLMNIKSEYLPKIKL